MAEETYGAAGDQGGGDGDELSPRAPEREDFVGLCRRLNEAGAKYVVVGGFAIIHMGLGRFTEDVDFIIDTALENEAKVFRVLESLPDQAVKELDPGDVEKFTVVRVADEIVVDLMKSAGGIDYAEAAGDVVVREVEGVSIPFASPRLLWRMKVIAHRPKDMGDLAFLRDYFRGRGEEPPA